MATSRRAALYVRVSTSDRGQTVENQLQPLQEAAGRLGWTVVAIYRDEGISGSLGRQKRPGLDALLKGVARREIDVVAAWSVCRLGRSLSDLIDLLWPCLVRQAGGVQRVREIDDPRSCPGWPGSRQGVWQAIGQAEDDAVQDRSHPCCLG